jgi:hypothetical protein
MDKQVRRDLHNKLFWSRRVRFRLHQAAPTAFLIRKFASNKINPNVTKQFDNFSSVYGTGPLILVEFFIGRIKRNINFN